MKQRHSGSRVNLGFFQRLLSKTIFCKVSTGDVQNNIFRETSVVSLCSVENGQYFGLKKFVLRLSVCFANDCIVELSVCLLLDIDGPIPKSHQPYHLSPIQFNFQNFTLKNSKLLDSNRNLFHRLFFAPAADQNGPCCHRTPSLHRNAVELIQSTALTQRITHSPSTIVKPQPTLTGESFRHQCIEVMQPAPAAL
jgi:hypothetical protein